METQGGICRMEVKLMAKNDFQALLLCLEGWELLACFRDEDSIVHRVLNLHVYQCVVNIYMLIDDLFEPYI